MTDNSKDIQTHDPYKWQEDMLAGAERERAEKMQASKDAMEAMRKKEMAKRAEMAELSRKTAEKIREDNKKLRDKEIAEAKAKAIADIEDEHNRKYGVPSDKSERINEALDSLAKDLIKGMTGNSKPL